MCAGSGGGGRTLMVGAGGAPAGVKTFAKDQISATLQRCILSHGRYV